MDILFKNNDGNIVKYNGIEFCGSYARNKCNKCPIKKQMDHTFKEDDCVKWIEDNAEKAAELMGYTLIQENKNKEFDRIQRHLEIITALNQLYAEKNYDYGDSFGKTYQEFGIISAITRISDKYNRLISLTTKPEEEQKVKDESIRDTLLDMANYCIMTVVEMENENKEDPLK